MARQSTESTRELAIQDELPNRLSIDDTRLSNTSNTSAASTSNEPPRRKPYLSSGKQITRSRVSKSCLTCRRRKVKCDTVHPICGTCEKTKSECLYSSSSLTDPSQPRRDIRDNTHGIKRRRDLNEQPVNTDGSSVNEVLSPYSILKEIQRGQDALRDQYSDSQAIAARLDQLTAVVEQWARTNDSQSLEELNIPGQQRLDQAINAGLQQNAHDSQGHFSDTTPPSGPSSKLRFGQTAQNENNSGDDFPIPSGLETDLVDPVGSLNLGHLSLEDGGKSRYVGTTYWAYISREITELNRLLRGQTRSREISPALSDGYSSVDEDEYPDPTLPASNHGTKTSPHVRKESFHKSVLFPMGDSPASQEKSIEPYMLVNVPTRRQSRILYKGFMSGVHAISPVMHPPSILEQYHQFWDWYEDTGQSGEPCPDPSFIPLLYAIWYGGSVTISLWTIRDEFNMESRAALSTLFHDEVTSWLRKISFPRNPSLRGLQAFLMVQTILSREEEPLASSLFISLALRVAQTMGLHRDPAQFGIKACEAETRRRIWWHIVHMDGVVAMSSGLPPLVSDENYWDVRDTSEVKDTLLGSAHADEYERMVNANQRKPDCPGDPNICGNSSVVNVYYLCARGKYVMAQAIRRILKIQLGTKPVTRKDMEVLRSILIELQSKLHAIVDRIPVSKSPRPPSRDGHNYHSAPACSSSTSMESSDYDASSDVPSCLEQYHSPVLVAFHKWARILLSLFVDKAFCVAYQPFLKNARSKIWPVARQRALRHCHGFMEKFILLATDPDFQPFQWSWPGNHQPMHATMIMLIDLYERPQTPEASKSRAFFIDKIFSLSGPDGVVGGENGISTSRPLRDGGREAWDMMRRLREKAWLKAGLEPRVLWTEQAQAEARHPYMKQMSTQVPKEHRVSPVQSFTDSYYTLIKEPYDGGNNNNQSTKRERERERGQGKEHKHKADTMQGGYPYTQPQSHRNDFSSYRQATSTVPQSQQADNQWPYPPQPSYPQTTDNTTNQPWPSGTQQFPTTTPINDPSQYQQSPLTANPPAPGAFNLATTPATNNSGTRPMDLPAFTSPQLSDTSVPLLSSSALDLDLDIQSQHQPSPQQQQLPNQPLNPNFAAVSPTFNTSLDTHNLQFDWDKWDAVFGPSIPVVDGLMHLDSINTGSGSGTSTGSLAGGTGTAGNVGIGIAGAGTGANAGGSRSSNDTDAGWGELGLGADENFMGEGKEDGGWGF
ncbi:hypothetical protein AJ79_06620 [Helicocarpus griseus UAMH5409]|uniref:C6 finger domain transcription factor nscR n=1 Tax=Helicocarpus griseus UAMH5409 TaxID=1447875 RepID=A0A2B7XAF7_9EURO|nr:hypothetical protein AJ79_06620 [Helicocarpus griseus UAMH5409]